VLARFRKWREDRRQRKIQAAIDAYHDAQEALLTARQVRLVKESILSELEAAERKAETQVLNNAFDYGSPLPTRRR
jgi:hypothetical protein